MLRLWCARSSPRFCTHCAEYVENVSLPIVLGRSTTRYCVESTHNLANFQAVPIGINLYIVLSYFGSIGRLSYFGSFGILIYTNLLFRMESRNANLMSTRWITTGLFITTTTSTVVRATALTYRPRFEATPEESVPPATQ